MTDQSNELGVIWGAEGIARALGITKRQAFHMLSKDQIKGARKMGGRWAITKNALANNFSQEAEGELSIRSG